VKDASIHGVGGCIVGEVLGCVPTVFRVEWPQDIKDDMVSERNPEGRITNSDLEMAGLLILFLVIEAVCTLKSGHHLALFSDNQPTVHWVRRMASKSSQVAGQLVRALALRMKIRGVSQLTTLHVEGKKNAMTDIPSRSFGSNPAWHCTSDAALLSLYNNKFPLPNQRSWTVFHLNSEIFSRVLAVLRMKDTSMGEWRRLSKIGRFIGPTGASTAELFRWTLTYRVSDTNAASVSSQASQDSP